MTSIGGVGTLRQNPQLASIFRSKKGGSAIDNKQLWLIWMTEACDKEAAKHANSNLYFITEMNFVKQCKYCKQCKQCKQIIARCYLHLWRYFFRFVCHLHQTRPGLCQMSTHSPIVVHHLLDVVIKATTSLLHVVSHLRPTWSEGKQILVTSIARCKIWWEHCARGKFYVWYLIDIFSQNFTPEP